MGMFCKHLPIVQIRSRLFVIYDTVYKLMIADNVLLLRRMSFCRVQYIPSVKHPGNIHTPTSPITKQT